ncbi:MAG: hypothetical protein Q9159_002058 [Coniocarpon cinnabarinum]
MDAVEVTQHSSVEDIEENKILIETLLESLDPGSDDYPQRHKELKSQRDHCESLLSAKRLPPSLHPSQHHQTPVNGNLACLTEPGLPNWASQGSVPFYTSNRNGAARDLTEIVPDQAETYASESSSGHLKRQRTGSNLESPAGNHKIRRMGQTLRPTTGSSSVSDDSLEELSIAPSQERVFDNYKRRLQEQEARFEQERRDREFARQLAQDFGGTPSIAPSVENVAPLQLHDNSFARPQQPQSFPHRPHATATSLQPNSPHVKHEPQNVFDSASSSALGRTYNADQPPSTDTSDDDVELISPQQFRPNHRTLGPSPHGPNMQSYSSSRFGQPDIPGAFPNDPWNSATAYNSSAFSQPSSSGFQGHIGNYGNNDMTTMQRLKNFIGGIPGSAFARPPSITLPSMSEPRSNYGSVHGRGGESVFGYNVNNAEPGPSGWTSQQLNDIRDRNMEYMLSDPAKTKEEIAQLLEDIQPDEEIPREKREGGPAALKVPLMEHQKIGLGWLKEQEESPRKGGILADDMGLGKTIQALALMLSRPSNDTSVKTTIIVAPVALLRQWQKEIETKVRTSQKLRVFIYHGASALKTKYTGLAQYDVVLTSYGTLGAELKRLLGWEAKKIEDASYNEPKPELNLLGDNCRWYRVILDEAQAIKGRNTNAAQATCRLQAEHRLVMTGTPMMNSVEELYSLIRFLRIPPYNDLTKFTKTFGPLKRNCSERVKAKTMKCLQALLKVIMIRRTKDSKIDDRPILNLKERFVGEDNAEFDDDQRAFYDHIEHKSQLQFNRYLDAGTVGRNYSNILVMLLRLRQVCDHPHLIEDHAIPVGAEATEAQMVNYAGDLDAGAVQRIKDADGAFECPVCYDGSENPTIFFPCGHDVCSDCFTKMMDPSLAAQRREDASNVKCPECRQTVDPRKVLTYNLFQKVHLPDAYKEKFGEDALNDGQSDTDSDPDSDLDSDFDEDDGSLHKFIVPDDEVEKEEEPGSETEDDDLEPWTSVKHEEASEDEFKPAPPEKAKSTTHKKAAWKKNKKGKGKAKVGKRTLTLAELKRESQRSKAAKKKYMRRLRKRFVSSSKIDKTLEILQGIRENDPTEKTIIFSQFTSFLDLLEIPVAERKWSYVRYDGSMNAKERHEAVETFSSHPDCNIMLISLKAGNAGLNLNCASQVIILDPFWNPFIEEQAIDRAHRIGQMRDVHVHRVLIQGTVEDRIVALQEKKRTLINQALDEKEGQKLSRLGREELIFLFGSHDREHDAGPSLHEDHEQLRNVIGNPR